MVLQSYSFSPEECEKLYARVVVKVTDKVGGIIYWIKC